MAKLVKIDISKLNPEQLRARKIIDEALEKSGMSPSGLAEKAKLAKTTITRFLKEPGDATPSEATLNKIKTAAGLYPIEPIAVKVVGKVQAGAFVEALDSSEDIDKTLYVNLPSKKLENVPLFALRINGQSMNKIAPHNSYVICAKIYDLDLVPRDGNIVIVHRYRHDLVEATCKILKIDEDGRKWLHPYSTETDHQQPIDYLGDHGVDEVKIDAIVVSKVDDFDLFY